MLIEGPKRPRNLVSSACLAAPAAETSSQDHGPREAWGFAMCFASSQGKPLHSRGEQQGWMPQRRLREAQWFCLDLCRELTVEPGLAPHVRLADAGSLRIRRGKPRLLPRTARQKWSFPVTGKSHLAAPVGGLVGQDVVLDLCSGRLPGDQRTLSGDVAGCQVCGRVQDCGGENAGRAWPCRSSPFESGTCVRLPASAVSGRLTRCPLPPAPHSSWTGAEGDAPGPDDNPLVS